MKKLAPAICAAAAVMLLGGCANDGRYRDARYNDGYDRSNSRVSVSVSDQNQNPPANESRGTPAVKTTEGNNPGAPFAGANSFTEGQAKARIESRGYSNVTNLTKDNMGIWRGRAQNGLIPVNVSLDFQGNVVAR